MNPVTAVGPRELQLPPKATTLGSWMPSALIWSIVFISFRPFDSGSADDVVPARGGDIVNQLGFGILGLVCLGLIATKVRRETVAAFASPLWLLFLPAVFIFSVLNADNFDTSMRAMIFSIIVLVAAFTAMALLTAREDFLQALTFSIGATLIFCYIAVLMVPEAGVHGTGGYEAQHAGLWRGVYDHKNGASYVMGAFAVAALYIMRAGKPFVGLAIAIFSLIFVVKAGSKTVLAVLPVAIAVPLLARWVTVRPLRLLTIITPVSALIAVTIGAAIHPPLLEWLRGYIPGLSYTGRMDLWIFTMEQIAKSPWTGYGFESFWTTPRVTMLDQPIELDWDVRGIVHGHNSWLDAVIAFGLPGAAVVLIAVVYVPLRDYLRIPDIGHAARLGTFFIGLWLICALGASLESFFMRRADPVWFVMVIAIVGLRLTARMSRQVRM